MKYHIYIQDEDAGDIAERLNPASEGVGYLVEDRFEAANFEGATTITQEWIAQRILSRPMVPKTMQAPGRPARGMPQASLLQRSRGSADVAGRSSQGRRALKAGGRVWPETKGGPFSGMFLVWKEGLSALMIGDETSPDGTDFTVKVKLLGRIDLNAHYLEAYEEEDDQGGKRFRLRSFPPIGPESEAGFIRYLVREGFVEKRWPGLSAHIQEQASWAFML
jgi:hypothetical protein